MAKYKAYPEYKDSGVEWLGDIPKNWDLKKLKYLSSIQTGNKDTVDAIEDGIYPFFVRSQIIEKINSIGANCEAVLTAGDGAGVGKIYHHYKGKFNFHQRVYMLSNFTKVNGRFVYYYLLANFYKVALEGNAKSTVDSLRLPQFLNFEFSFPDTKEQSSIIRQLDILCSYTDSLIEKAEKLIELLKEKRQAVISHTVTKGLNPDASMKDSGVEWFGDVPDNWKIASIKYVSKIINGSTPKSDVDKYWNSNISWFTPSDLSQKENIYIKSSIRQITIDGLNSCGTSLVPEHSLILSTRAPIGSVAITASEACTNQGCKALVTTNKNLSLFLYYQLSSLTEQLNNIGRGSTFLELSTDDLGSFKLSIPDSDIEKIVSYLRNKTTKIDTLIQKQLQQIDLLKERRTALISAAVTGKIDLRDWTPPASSTEASLTAEEATA